MTLTLSAGTAYTLRYEFRYMPGVFGGTTPVSRLSWSGPDRTLQPMPNAADTASPAVTTTTRYLYDGWNLLAEVSTAGSAVRSYTWGLDLSGSSQGAGGVGGLLALTDNAGNAVHFAAYDGNGNISGLVRADAGTLSASYDYNAFGETMLAEGAFADGNPFRFSTKYTDSETGLLYYGYRYYNPSTGRWLNRDPIGEEGGVNLFGFVRNNPIDFFDKLGLVIVNLSYEAYIETATVTFLGQTFNGGIKIRHSINVDTDTESLSQTEKYIGHTIEYDAPGGKVIREGQSGGSTVRASIDFRGPARGQGEPFFRVKLVADEGNPLVSHAPGITYEVYVYFYKCSKTMSWTGTHDRFPSHAFSVKRKRVHQFSHVMAGTTPLSLSPPASNERFSGSDTF